MREQPEGKSQRLMRIEHEIVRELSAIVHEELKDPRVGFVTILAADVAPDVRSARIYASPLGDERASQNTMKGLQSAAGFLSAELGKRMHTRHTPSLTFIRDSSIERGVRVSQVIDEVLKRDEQKNNER